METWAIVTLVIGLNIITVLSSYLLTKMQVSHSDKRLERELERAREADSRQRRWDVRGEPLLKLRGELARMATKQDRLLAAAHRQHTHFDVTEEEVKNELQIAIDDWNAYLMRGEFSQVVLMQYDTELINKVEEIIRDYRNSYIDATLYYSELKAKERTEAMEVFERNKTRIIEVQSLINKRLEEL